MICLNRSETKSPSKGHHWYAIIKLLVIEYFVEREETVVSDQLVSLYNFIEVEQNGLYNVISQ